jgi:hypothetical protein
MPATAIARRPFPDLRVRLPFRRGAGREDREQLITRLRSGHVLAVHRQHAAHYWRVVASRVN